MQRTYLLLLKTTKEIVNSFKTDRFLFQRPNFGTLDVLLQYATPKNKIETKMYFLAHLQQAAEVIFRRVLKQKLHASHIFPVIGNPFVLAFPHQFLHILISELIYIAVLDTALNTATDLLQDILDLEISLAFIFFLLAFCMSGIARFNSFIQVTVAVALFLFLFLRFEGLSAVFDEAGQLGVGVARGGGDRQERVYRGFLAADLLAVFAVVDVPAGAQAWEDQAGACFLHGFRVFTIKCQYYYLLLHIQVFQFIFAFALSIIISQFYPSILSIYPQPFSRSAHTLTLFLRPGQQSLCFGIKFYYRLRCILQKFHEGLSMKNNLFSVPSQPSQWLAIYTHIKSQSSYSSIISQTNSYKAHITALLSTIQQQPYIPSLTRKSQHTAKLSQLRYTYSQLVSQLHMLQLGELAQCVENGIEKLVEVLGAFYGGLEVVLGRLNQERNFNKEHFHECQQNGVKNKIEHMMTSMTMTSTSLSFLSPADKKTRHRDLQHLTSPSPGYENSELSYLIDQVLERKEMILGNNGKNKSNNIYEEIVQYLENIPQGTIALSKENGASLASCVVGGLQEVQVGNFGEQLEKNFGLMLKQPIKRLILRIFSYARKLYHKTKQSETISTQTLLIKDEDNIKMLLKNVDSLKRELEMVRKAKREAEQDMVRVMDNQQAKELRISELAAQGAYLRQRLAQSQTQITTLHSKLQTTQKNKRESQQKIIKDYTNERSIYMKSIRELELKIECTSNQLMRLRKQTQGNMVSLGVGTEWDGIGMPGKGSVQVQTQDRISFVDFDGSNRNSNGYGNGSSRKNFVTKFTAGINRKSVNNGNQLAPNETDTINETAEPEKPEILSKHFTRQGRPSKEYKTSKLKEQNREEIYSNVKGKQNMLEEKRSQKSHKKRESIVDSIRAGQDRLRGGLAHEGLGHNDRNIQQAEQHKESQTITNIVPRTPPYPQIQSQLTLHLQTRSSKLSKQPEPFPHLASSDRKRASPSPLIRSRTKMQSSRMFISKPHCHPYIGGSFTVSMGQTAWLDLIEVNCLRRENQAKEELEREGECGEKIKFLSRIMEKYSVLKESGLLNRINEIVSSGEIQRDSELVQLKTSQNNQVLAPKESTVLTPMSSQKNRNKKSVQIRKSKKQEKLEQPIKIDKIEEVALLPNREKVFNKNQVILLFGSIQYARKYELNLDVWGNLENSIMLDYNFMAICDHVQLFFAHIQTTQPQLYTQCVQLLNLPIHYLQARQILNPSPKRTHNNPNPNNKQKEKEITDKTPHELRNIFHKILRFHKVVHRKCGHVQEFLAIIGFDCWQAQGATKKIL